jgi:DNA-directed RNA polymerase subunit K/omega
MFGSNITKFEKARIIGTRAQHLANGAAAKIDTTNMECTIDIATKEYEQGLIPIIIIRNYPSRVEEIKLFFIK